MATQKPIHKIVVQFNCRFEISKPIVNFQLQHCKASMWKDLDALAPVANALLLLEASGVWPLPWHRSLTVSISQNCKQPRTESVPGPTNYPEVTLGPLGQQHVAEAESTTKVITPVQ